MKIDGLTVIDATKPIKLVITKRDIELGNTKNPAACAAARAAVRQFHVEAARVHLSRVFLKINGKWRRYEAPGSLRTEIVSFDRGGGFRPGEHYLAAPRPSHKTGARAPGRGRTRKTKRVRPYHISTGIRAHGMYGGGDE